MLGQDSVQSDSAGPFLNLNEYMYSAYHPAMSEALWRTKHAFNFCHEVFKLGGLVDEALYR